MYLYFFFTIKPRELYWLQHKSLQSALKLFNGKDGHPWNQQSLPRRVQACFAHMSAKLFAAHLTCSILKEEKLELISVCLFICVLHVLCTLYIHFCLRCTPHSVYSVHSVSMYSVHHVHSNLYTLIPIFRTFCYSVFSCSVYSVHPVHSNLYTLLPIFCNFCSVYSVLSCFVYYVQKTILVLNIREYNHNSFVNTKKKFLETYQHGI